MLALTQPLHASSIHQFADVQTQGAIHHRGKRVVVGRKSFGKRLSFGALYVAPGYARQGVGLRLYTALIDALRCRKIQVVLGGIAQPNPASVALHENLGFEKVAHFKRVGRKFEQWIDVGYWELQLG